jgi:hypothetical protein
MVDIEKEHSTFLQGYDQRKRARDLPRAGGTEQGKGCKFGAKKKTNFGKD